jgi:hypothetical protein
VKREQVLCYRRGGARAACLCVIFIGTWSASGGRASLIVGTGIGWAGVVRWLALRYRLRRTDIRGGVENGGWNALWRSRLKEGEGRYPARCLISGLERYLASAACLHRALCV